MSDNGPGAKRGSEVAATLRSLGVRGILITLAEEGALTEVACQMPECLCPIEMGGRAYFEPAVPPMQPWAPNMDHIELESEGGHRTRENSRLAHVLCNRVDYNKTRGISYAKDLATVDRARREARGQRPRDPSSHLGDMFVAPGDGLTEKARFVKENLKDPQTKKHLSDLVRTAPQDFVTDMKDVLSVFRRKRNRPDPMLTSQMAMDSSNEEDPVKELLSVEEFRSAVARNTPILNVDLPTATEVLHPHPGNCSGVDERWFTQKVVENERSTGGYFAVSDEDAARHRWPLLTVCKRCS